MHAFAIDDSASMLGADVTGHRYSEVRHALERIGARCRCQRELVSIVHFDPPTEYDLAPTPIARLDAIEPALVEAGYASSLAASLDYVEGLAAAHPDHEVTLTVISDFFLFDPPGTMERLGAFPGKVRAVVARSNNMEELFEGMDNVEVTLLGQAETAGALASAVFETLTEHRTGVGHLGGRQRGKARA